MGLFPYIWILSIINLELRAQLAAVSIIKSLLLRFKF